MQTLLITITAVFLFTALMCLGITFGAFFGRQRQERCACAAARRAAKLLDQRKRDAKKYSPETVDINHLPVIDASIKKGSTE